MAKAGLGVVTRGEAEPIQIGCFTLGSVGMEVSGQPSFVEWERVGDFIQRTVKASKFWLADWLRYGSSRADWADRLSQAVDVTGLSAKTLQNVRAVGAIDKSRRRDGVEFGLHAEVAGLEPEQQTEWLEKCSAGGWDRRVLRNAIKASHRLRVLNGKADEMHAVEVMVLVDLEARNETVAQDQAWGFVKDALQRVQQEEGRRAAHISAKVIASHARPR